MGKATPSDQRVETYECLILKIKTQALNLNKTKHARN